MTEPQGSDLVLERLTKLHPKLIDLVLDRVWRLLARVGHPERRLPPVVHVAGTNGKGSTIAYLRAILEAAGYRVHVYTSPHLVRFHERIRLAGTLIDEGELLALLEECERANGGEPITFFEITTVAAFLAFTRHPADILLLEVGLGGTYDATNVVERPLACCLTPISYDHTQHLGHTLEKIAANKAGIMKRGRPAVIGAQPEEALAVFERRAAELGCRLSRFGREWEAWRDGDRLVFRDGAGETRWPLPGLPGEHQIGNAGIALATLPLLEGFRVPDGAIAQGVVGVEWPARLQRLRHGPAVDVLPAGWEAWLDGGHNESGGQALGVHAAAWRRERPDLPIRLVYGMLSTHDPVGFLKPLIPHVQDVTAVAVGGNHQALGVEALAEAARRAGAATVRTAVSVEEAASAIVAADPRPARLLVCGSLYLAGQVLRKNG
ncbi:MAG: bifunctional folylpolyglutamate synthase/dihydrofolate synthase [Pseudomonadota bacterium]